jgi:hypothetical protein
MKGANRDRFRRVAIDEIGDALLRVGGIGERHRRLCEPEAPARPERHPASEPREASDDIGETGPEDQPIVEITVRRLVSPIKPVIIAMLGAQVERSRGEVIVEETVKLAGRTIAYDQERPMLVERVAGARVKAQRVGHGGAQPAALEVERSRLVAEPVIAILRVARHRMQQIGPVPAKAIGAADAVGGEENPVGAIPAQVERREPNLDRDFSAFQGQSIF